MAGTHIITREPATTVALGAPGYPGPLYEISSPPGILYVSGRLVKDDDLAVAIVGSRRPTHYGISMAQKLSRSLVRYGFTVVSGMARGIDTAAHRAALDAGGRTIGILGCGLDQDYPRGSMPLKARISRHGAILTEFPPETKPVSWNFPQRNRIISGLSLAVVVVEADLKSGSLITARWALDQGREVMAVPGRADSSMSRGTLALIRDGAVPVACAADVVHSLGIERTQAKKAPDLPPSRIIRELDTRPMRPEEIARAVNWPIPKVLTELSHLEIAGLIEKNPGGTYSIR